MVQQLNKHEREAHRWEFPMEPGGFRVRIYLDRENQASADERERSIRYRAIEAQHKAQGWWQA